MTVFRLVEQVVFPDPNRADSGGLLAVGGDLSTPRLLMAYSMGIFPWFSEGEPILWWSPDPRCILQPDEMRISRRLAREMRRDLFTITFDRAFSEVVDNCASLRKDEGTWITSEMAKAYNRLHELGYAHSVEAWQDGALAGGLYGVALGRCFFGESMFFRKTGASKIALATLAQRLQELDYELIDCQLVSSHLLSLGARPVPRPEFLQRLLAGGVRPALQPSRGSFPS